MGLRHTSTRGSSSPSITELTSKAPDACFEHKGAGVAEWRDPATLACDPPVRLTWMCVQGARQHGTLETVLRRGPNFALSHQDFGGRPATAQPLLLGITKASLSTDSFISAASPQ